MNKSPLTRFRKLFLFLICVTSVILLSFQSNFALIEGYDGPSFQLNVIRSDEYGLLLEVIVEDFQLTEIWTDNIKWSGISITGTDLSTEPGAPQLPVINRLVGLPPQGTADVNILEYEIEYLPGHYSIVPAPGPALLDNELTPGEWDYSPDNNIYQLNSFYPSKIAEFSNEAWVRDHRISNLTIIPFQYNPVTGSVKLYRRLLIDISFSSPINSTVLEISDYSIGEFNQILSSSLLNFDQAKEWTSINDIYSYSSSMTGPRYKIVVVEDGLYKITYSDMQAAGMDVDNVDPLTFHMSNQGFDIDIYVQGEGDGIFDAEDFILFYGEEFRGDVLAERYENENTNWLTYTQQLSDGSQTLWHPENSPEMFEKYTDENIYWLQVDQTPDPPRMNLVDAAPGIAQTPSNYREKSRGEETLRRWDYHFTGEDTWFWEGVADTDTHVYTTTISEMVTDPFSATLRGEVVAFDYKDSINPDHHTRFWINSRMDLLDDAYWDGRSRYSFDVQIDSRYINEGNNLLLFNIVNDVYPNQYQYIFFDWYEIEYDRQFIAVDDQLMFSFGTGGEWKYVVNGFSSSFVDVLDITNPFNPIRLDNTETVPVMGNYQVAFQVTHPDNESYILVGEDAVLSPGSITFYDPPNLRSTTIGADYIAISHSDFIEGSQALASYRSSQGMRTIVVDADDLYNEFNDGIYNPISFKNFLKFAFENWQSPAPNYVVLIGDGHWDIRGDNPDRYGDDPIFLPPNLGWVDPWQGEVDSANLLATIIGDDPLPDIHISRIPVNNPSELVAFVDKLISYDQVAFMDWQLNNLFIADDTPDPAGDFVAFSESIIEDYVRPGYTPISLYLDDYEDNNGLCGIPPFSGGPSCPNFNTAITETMSYTGSSFVNYIGHAWMRFWSNEKVLLYRPDDPSTPNDFFIDDIGSLKNDERLPVVLSLTCLDGYWFHPQVQHSLAELFIRTPEVGAVGTFSPTGLGVASGHDALQRGFYSTVFDDGVWEFGNATLGGKLAVYASGGNFDLINTFTVFGDPALRIKNQYAVDISPLVSEKSGLAGSVVTYSHQIQNSGSLTDTYDISISGNEWVTTVPITQVILLPGESYELISSVNIPNDLPGGSTDPADITVRSLGDKDKKITSTTLTTADVYGLVLRPAYVNKFDLPGSTITYTFSVTNTSNNSDEYNLIIGNHEWTTIPEDSTIGPLNPNESIEFNVYVHIPGDAEDNSFDTVVITLYSFSDPLRIALSSITTTAVIYPERVYLTVIYR
jgi:hypothetical protein